MWQFVQTRHLQRWIVMCFGARYSIHIQDKWSWNKKWKDNHLWQWSSYIHDVYLNCVGNILVAHTNSISKHNYLFMGWFDSRLHDLVRYCVCEDWKCKSINNLTFPIQIITHWFRFCPCNSRKEHLFAAFLNCIKLVMMLLQPLCKTGPRHMVHSNVLSYIQKSSNPPTLYSTSYTYVPSRTSWLKIESMMTLFKVNTSRNIIKARLHDNVRPSRTFTRVSLRWAIGDPTLSLGI